MFVIDWETVREENHSSLGRHPVHHIVAKKHDTTPYTAHFMSALESFNYFVPDNLLLTILENNIVV